jgi:hypothetical protein
VNLRARATRVRLSGPPPHREQALPVLKKYVLTYGNRKGRVVIKSKGYAGVPASDAVLGTPFVWGRPAVVKTELDFKDTFWERKGAASQRRPTDGSRSSECVELP